MGPVGITIKCTGAADRSNVETAALPQEALPLPKQPEDYIGPVIIEAENMDYKSVNSVALTHSGWWATDMSEFAGMGYVVTGTNSAASLRHQLKLKSTCATAAHRRPATSGQP